MNLTSYQLKIKLVLVFFLFLTSGCDKISKASEITPIYEGGKATKVTFKSTVADFKIYRKGSKDISVLGDYYKNDSGWVFTPVVPFTRNSNYEIRSNNNVIGEFYIKEIDNDDRKVEILKIYPTIDTVPQNLLKIYLKFSESMQAVGNSKEFIKIKNLSDNKDTQIFLELQNELWNRDRTMLTLWLDPGRIKQDLIPNRELGTPLEEGSRYEINISENWKSSKGEKLDKDYIKLLVVGPKDTTSPNIENWVISEPAKQTLDPLLIEFGEVLDAQLASETIKIYSENNELLNGVYKLGNNEKEILFLPDILWKTGEYTIRVDSKLEDLAGNNLNRLFDTDLHSENTIKIPSDYKELNFRIN